ncbi:ATP-binding protein [Verrucomicrobiales bacterium]|nr:ATP-binding protein [Verrucomicrobiales bacterium]
MNDKAGKPPEVSPANPWLGLASFTEEASSYFFGRELEIEDIHARIRKNQLTIIYGQPGLGKTSLLGAGVIPKLRKSDFTPILVRLRYEGDSPSLLHQTRNALSKITGIDFDNELTLWETLHRLPVRFSNDSPKPVVIFDQFEEIYTLGQETSTRRKQAKKWLTEIADLIQNRPPNTLAKKLRGDRSIADKFDFRQISLNFVISLRSDFLSNLEAWKSELPQVMRNRVALHPLNGSQAMQATLGPATLSIPSLATNEVALAIVRIASNALEAATIQEIKVSPPILSLLCEQLNQSRIDNGYDQITTSLVKEESHDVLQQFYEDCFSFLTNREARAIRDLVEQKLVTVSGHRTSLAQDDAEAFISKRGGINPETAFNTLVTRRLITIEDHGIPRLELTHDVLLPIVVASRAVNTALERRRKKLRFVALALAATALLVAAGFLGLYQLRQSHYKQFRKEFGDAWQESFAKEVTPGYEDSRELSGNTGLLEHSPERPNDTLFESSLLDHLGITLKNKALIATLEEQVSKLPREDFLLERAVIAYVDAVVKFENGSAESAYLAANEAVALLDEIDINSSALSDEERQRSIEYRRRIVDRASTFALKAGEYDSAAKWANTALSRVEELDTANSATASRLKCYYALRLAHAQFESENIDDLAHTIDLITQWVSDYTKADNSPADLISYYQNFLGIISSLVDVFENPNKGIELATLLVDMLERRHEEFSSLQLNRLRYLFSSWLAKAEREAGFASASTERLEWLEKQMSDWVDDVRLDMPIAEQFESRRRFGFTLLQLSLDSYRSENYSESIRAANSAANMSRAAFQKFISEGLNLSKEDVYNLWAVTRQLNTQFTRLASHPELRSDQPHIYKKQEELLSFTAQVIDNWLGNHGYKSEAWAWAGEAYLSLGSLSVSTSSLANSEMKGRSESTLTSKAMQYYKESYSRFVQATLINSDDHWSYHRAGVAMGRLAKIQSCPDSINYEKSTVFSEFWEQSLTLRSKGAEIARENNAGEIEGWIEWYRLGLMGSYAKWLAECGDQKGEKLIRQRQANESVILLKRGAEANLNETGDPFAFSYRAVFNYLDSLIGKGTPIEDKFIVEAHGFASYWKEQVNSKPKSWGRAEELFWLLDRLAKVYQDRSDIEQALALHQQRFDLYAKWIGLLPSDGKVDRQGNLLDALGPNSEGANDIRDLYGDVSECYANLSSNDPGNLDIRMRRDTGNGMTPAQLELAYGRRMERQVKGQIKVIQIENSNDIDVKELQQKIDNDPAFGLRAPLDLPGDSDDWQLLETLIKRAENYLKDEGYTDFTISVSGENTNSLSIAISVSK